MKLSNMFKKTSRRGYISLGEGKPAHMAPEVPEGLLKKCNVCKSAILTEDVKKGYYICPKCQNYFRVHAMHRIEMVADAGTFEEWDKGLTSGNPLHYKGYEEKVEALQEKTGLDEAVVTGKARIAGNEVVLAVCDGRFMMASMGKVVGEKITRAVEKATSERIPIIIFACSGGARMQEGIHSLMQMAKTSAALKRHSDAGFLYIPVLTDPTTGGVTASFAMLGDIILAEPGALIGFAGPRVIRQTIGQELPEGFQRAEFLLEHGFVDAIVKRDELKKTLAHLLDIHKYSGAYTEVKENVDTYRSNSDIMKKYLEYLDNIYFKKIDREEEKKAEADNNLYNEYDVWEKVEIARSSERPNAADYIEKITKDFFELHGDRNFCDDKAIIGGIATFGGIPVTVIGHMKGKTTKENISRNFGMPNPEGYRKALRLMKQAEKFNRPVICFIDTPGAYCGLGAEERGQGEAIAKNLYEMSSLTVPVLSIVTGEGGSGGALALGVANEVWMMENSIYSILSPEGFASILWKDSKKAKEAAEIMKLTSADLYELGIIEKVIPEYPVINENNIKRVTLYMKRMICDFMYRYIDMDKEELARQRYNRFRKM